MNEAQITFTGNATADAEMRDEIVTRLFGDFACA